VYTEARTVLRVALTDLFFRCWCLEMTSDKRIQYVSGSVYINSPNFKFGSFLGM
jgi:hypothetical protein